MAWDDLVAPGVRMWASDVESQRFGRSVHRMTIGPGTMDESRVLEALGAIDADVVILRYDAARLELAGLLARTGRVVLPAGALTYWEKPVTSRAAGSDRDGSEEQLDVVDATASDLADVASVVRDIVRTSFEDYGNHYTANPLLDRADALAGYEDWAARSLDEAPADVLVLREGGRPIGVATLEAGDGHLEVLLAGLAPAAQGRGRYATLLDACHDLAAARCLGRLVISTQVHNVRPQRAWARRGMRPFAAVETVHLVQPALLAR